VFFAKWSAETILTLRRFFVLCILLALLVIDWFAWRNSQSRQQRAEQSAPSITKEPVIFASLTFDPAAPPPNMPPLSAGESAECDSDFQSSASVRGETQSTDATHATVTITHVTMKLQLKINIWLPAGANQHLTEHEDGHRQISEAYYQSADKLAERVASTFLGRRVEISGTDLAAESNKALQQMASEITAEYNKELDPNPAQLLYDSITDHGRNEVTVKDAVGHALKNVSIEAPAAKTSAP